MDPICTLQARADDARAKGKLGAAERHLRAALDVLARRGEAEHPDAANLACELAELLSALRRDGEAEELARGALTSIERALAAARRARLAADARLALERIRLAALQALAAALRGQGRYSEARPLVRRAVARSARVLGERAPETAGALVALGVLAKYEGDYGRAGRAYGRAREILEGAREPDEAALGTLSYDLACLAHARGEHARAEPLVRAALETLSRALGERHPDVGVAHVAHGAILHGLGRLDEAAGEYRRARAVLERAYGRSHPDGSHPDVALVSANEAELERARGNLARAERLAREALALRRERLGPDHPQVATSLNNLALVLAERGRRAEAARLLARARDVCVARCGAEHPSARLLARNLEALTRRAPAAGKA